MYPTNGPLSNTFATLLYAVAKSIYVVEEVTTILCFTNLHDVAMPLYINT